MDEPRPTPAGLRPAAGIAWIVASQLLAGAGLMLAVDGVFALSHLPYLVGVGVLVWHERHRSPLWGGLWVIVALLGVAGTVAVMGSGHAVEPQAALRNATNGLPAWTVLASVADTASLPQVAGLLRGMRWVLAALLVVVLGVSRLPDPAAAGAVVQGAAWIWFALFVVAQGAMLRLAWVTRAP